MKRFLQKMGTVVFWLSWPLLYVYLRHGQRTRLLLVHEGEVLLVQNWHSGGKWSVPGGGLRRGEDPKQGAVRELLEETSIEVQSPGITLIDEGIHHSHGLSYQYLCFGAQTANKQQPKAHLPEIFEAQWVPIRALNADNTSGDALRYIAQWQQRS